MKIKVEEGTVVKLDRQRNTSRKGGIYDISDLPEEERKRLLSTKGVSEVGAAKTSGSDDDVKTTTPSKASTKTSKKES